jgi:hypothetical protein
VFNYLWIHVGSKLSGSISGGSAVIVLGEYNTYAELPPADATNNQHIAKVLTTTGIIGINRRVKGWYISNGVTWEKYETDQEGIDAITSHEALYAHDQIALNSAARHSHANKALLDTYDQTNADLLDAVSKKHLQNTDTHTSSASFQLQPGNGPILKNVGGELQLRNYLDLIYGNLRVGSVYYDGDLVGPLRDSYLEISRTSGLVSSAILWTSAAKVQKIREINVTRSGSTVIQVQHKEYDKAGFLVKTYDGTLSRSSGQIVSVTGVES